MSKYNAKKTIVDGITFDSKKEAKRYRELRVMENAGEISSLRLQPKYELIPAQYSIVDGKKKCIERATTYSADFSYIKDGKEIVEDVKGFRQMPVWIIKRKLMLYKFGIQVKEI